MLVRCFLGLVLIIVFGASCASQSSDTSRGALEGTGDGETRRTASAAPPAFATVVATFYSKLNSRDYKAAYSLLSPSFQKTSPYAEWLAGYANTVLSSPKITTTNDPTSLSIALTAVDRTAHGLKATTYEGEMHGIRTAVGSWLIDDATLHDTTPRAKPAIVGQPPSQMSQEDNGAAQGAGRQPPPVAAPPPVPVVGSAGCDEATLEWKSDDGDYIGTQEGQKFHVMAGDESTVITWTAGDDLVICEDKIIDKDDDSEIEYY
jgi:hypothetical protein